MSAGWPAVFLASAELTHMSGGQLAVGCWLIDVVGTTGLSLTSLLHACVFRVLVWTCFLASPGTFLW